MGSEPNWYQQVSTGNKTFYISNVSNFCIEKGYLYSQAWKCFWHVNVYFTEQNIMQIGDNCVFYRPEHNARGQHHGTDFSTEM